MKPRKTFYETESPTQQAKFTFSYSAGFLFLAGVLVVVPWVKANFYLLYGLLAFVLFIKGMQLFLRALRQYR